jgi:D-arabinose 1-dehydrogenase-like Zn-dependent alcohol dehydrogenase
MGYFVTKYIPLTSSKSRMLLCWAASTSTDSEDTFRFAERTCVRPNITARKTAEAHVHMLSGKAQFRVVLKM